MKSATMVLLQKIVEFPNKSFTESSESFVDFKRAKFHYHIITATPETELPLPVDAFQCHVNAHLKDS
ncbi:unnamed protein product, partial [Gulo gulo]